MTHNDIIITDEEFEAFRANQRLVLLRALIMANNALGGGGSPDEVIEALQNAKDEGIDQVTIADALANGLKYYRPEDTRPLRIARGESGKVRAKLETGVTSEDRGMSESSSPIEDQPVMPFRFHNRPEKRFWPENGTARQRISCWPDGALARGSATAELHHETGRDLSIGAFVAHEAHQRIAALLATVSRSARAAGPPHSP